MYLLLRCTKVCSKINGQLITQLCPVRNDRSYPAILCAPVVRARDSNKGSVPHLSRHSFQTSGDRCAAGCARAAHRPRAGHERLAARLRRDRLDCRRDRKVVAARLAIIGARCRHFFRGSSVSLRAITSCTPLRGYDSTTGPQGVS